MMTRTGIWLMGVVLLLGAIVGPAAAQRTPLEVDTLVTNLDQPTYATHPPGDDTRLFILEKPGMIRVYDIVNDTLLSAPFLDIDSRVVNITGGFDERGLLGLTFDPNYDENGYFYVDYIDTSAYPGDTVVERYQVSESDPNLALFNSNEPVFTLNQPFENHNGGWINFGPDGHLYISVGDGGSADDPSRNGQNLLVYFGKMLRVDVSNGLPYGIPADNPFLGPGALDEIWAFGLRNAWRNSFDRLTGDLWIGDVGQDEVEEIDVQPADSTGGENYGWDCKEGTNEFEFTFRCETSTFTDPVYEYSHGPPCRSVTGGYVYRGCEIPDLRGRYVFGDFCTGQVFSGVLQGGQLTDVVLEFSLGLGLSSFAEDENGELYVLTGIGSTSGALRKIVAAEPVTEVACDDQVACTMDFCGPDFGCEFVPDDSACDDGDPCTADSCNGTSGCLHLQIPGCGDAGACCQAGDACTVVASSDACDALQFVCNVTTNVLPECGGACGSTCYGDVNGDGQVTVSDRGFIAANVGETNPGLLCQYDLDGSGGIAPSDRGFVSANIGICQDLPDFQNGSGLHDGQPDSRFAAPLFLGGGTTCEDNACP